MPATPQDIAAGSLDAVLVRWTRPAIKARYASAMDTTVMAREGFCDNPADAQALAEQEGDLLGAERARFAVTTDGVAPLDPALGVPLARLVDAEHAVDAAMLVARIEIDLEAETTSLELYG